MNQTNLNTYMGLDGNGYDASGSKKMTVNDTTQVVTYQYTRGGVTLTAEIDLPSQKITWKCNGVDSSTNPTRWNALCEGLKLPSTGTGALDGSGSTFTKRT